MAGVYSTRFLLASGTVVARYTVPPGKVAVVKMVTAVNPSTLGQQVVLYIGTPAIWSSSIPGNASVAPGGMMIVVNAGEQLAMALTEGSMHGTASGYLLDQLPGR